MAKPMIAIVGRPNVGKSTLFNKIIGTRISIVEDTPGVTRDRIYAEGEWLDKKFTLVDTGGIEPKDNDTILRHIKDQAQIAIDTADVILFVTDIRSGVTANDYDVATMLLKSVKPQPSLKVEADKCKSCKRCMKLGCPAISLKDGKARIDNTLCVGCGVCEQLCAFDAIGEVSK